MRIDDRRLNLLAADAARLPARAHGRRRRSQFLSQLPQSPLFAVAT
jgi:hypothetical protein